MLHKTDFADAPTDLAAPRAAIAPRHSRGGPVLALLVGGVIVGAVGAIIAVSDPYAHLTSTPPVVLSLAAHPGATDRMVEPTDGRPQPAPSPVATLHPIRIPGDLPAQAVAPDPFSLPAPIPAAPAAPVDLAAAAQAETVLGLTRRDRVAIQQRLARAGHDPRGADGVFGPATRQAITAWQSQWGFAATGHLSSDALAILVARTEPATPPAAAPTKRSARAPLTATPPSARQVAEPVAVVQDGCQRGADGQVIGGQSLLCDLAGFGETILDDQPSDGTRLARRDEARD